MKIIHPGNKMRYLPRFLTLQFREAVEHHPVVVLTGARQVGKSTFLRRTPPTNQWRYLTLDDFDVLSQAQQDARALLSGSGPLVIDEVQKEPRLLSAVKQRVDESGMERRYVLSGSANLLLLEQVSETLAGRAVYLTLGPMTFRETQESPPSPLLEELLAGKIPDESRTDAPNINLDFWVWRGGMPPLASVTHETAILRWWEGYVATYLERDLRQLRQINSLADFRQVMVAAALRNGQLMNQTEISRDVSVSQPTVHRYLNLLSATHLLGRLPAYARNRTKRLVKSSKLFFADTGLAAFLCGYYDVDTIRDAKIWGGFFEGFVFQHLHILGQLLTPQARLFYWRTTSGAEVDFVIEHGKRLLAIEVKSASAIRYADAANLRLFLQEYPEASCGVVCYCGDEIIRLDERIIAIPWRLF
jgi:hypothetical protein